MGFFLSQKSWARIIPEFVQPISATSDTIGNSYNILYGPYRDGKTIDLDA